MIFDSHAHLNFRAFDQDRDQVIGQCLQKDIWMINVGSNFLSSKKAVEIANQYKKGVFASVGLHPINIKDKPKIKETTPKVQSQSHSKEDVLEEKFDYFRYQELAKNKNVVAIGEIGLDYYYKPKTKKRLEEFKIRQIETFLEQLSLARELSLPVIFHCRMAHDDMIQVLKKNYHRIEGVIHCFTGNWEQAKEYLNMGFYLGFNGIIFKLNLDEVIKKTPLERILLETDCPYLSPPGYKQRNDPMSLPIIAQKIAKIKKITQDLVLETTFKNTKKLFIDKL